MPEDRFSEETFQTKITTKTLLKIFSCVKPYKLLVLGFIFFIALTGISNSIVNLIGKNIIDLGVMKADKNALILYIVCFSVITFFIAGTVFGFIYCASLLGEKIQYDLRKKVFDHLQTLSFSYFDKTPVGWIISRGISDTVKIADLCTWFLVDTIWAIVNIVSSIICMFLINWMAALVVSCFIPVIIVIALKLKKYILSEFRKVRSINSKITAAYNENITGVRIVKSFTREKKNLHLFNELSYGMKKSSFRAAWLAAFFLPVVQIISAVMIGIIIWISPYQIKSGFLTIGGIQAFIGYILFMTWPIQDLARVYAHMQHSIAGAERVFSLLETEPEIADKPGCKELKKIQGAIEFRHVRFYYEKENPVLKDFQLKVHEGETIALVGPTGGGKSTIVNLVCRFYEPREGKILFNGVDYTEYSQRSIQSKLGVVLQTPHLFSGTIMENIRYGRINAADTEVIDAAKCAYADEFIQKLKDGYEAETGEGGVLLSFGQKQLISMARAILAKPEIIIMDEATSSIDTITESLIQKGIEALLKDSTAFIIAHRLSTIKNADRILYIQDGKIQEMGTHRELLKIRGHYFTLYTSQFRAEKEQDFFTAAAL
ncbi:MAG: ABC transporter ATP-binding protein [Spirochaetales bacterium]|nr:ABC transporter ATP-binding protein [Spirochaetales bacterium]